MPMTLDDVAERAGVSRALVSRALNGGSRVSAGTRERILQAAQDLGYRPNLNARRLASRRTGTIGVLLADLHNPLFAELLDGFDEGLGDDREQVLLASGFREPQRERAAVDSFLAVQVDAIVLLGSQLPSSEIEELSRQTPTVAVGRPVRGVDSVVIDDAAGVRLVLEHLISLGHQRIAHIDGGHGARAASRRRAYTELMRSHGLTAHVQIHRGDYTEEAGEAGFQHIWYEAAPTAIFAANDLSALGVLSGARSKGVDVPAELSVVGFDDTTLARYGCVSLTTVGHPRTLMGALAAELVRSRLADPSKKPHGEVLIPSLVVRSTTAEPDRR